MKVEFEITKSTKQTALQKNMLLALDYFESKIEGGKYTSQDLTPTTKNILEYIGELRGKAYKSTGNVDRSIKRNIKNGLVKEEVVDNGNETLIAFRPVK